MLFTKKFGTYFVAATLACAGFTACSKNNDDNDGGVTPIGNSIKGTINSSMTLTADKEWTLNGYVYVPSGVTLTIEAGTTIKADTIAKGAICVERGGKIVANGTADKPIVFTTAAPAGSRRPGQWGGVCLLGSAKTNRTSTPIIEGGLDRPYGGTNDDDSSGVLKYVRIEYAGISAFPNSEINGLTLGGVGRKTVLDHIQVSYGNDDAYEFFGGTVNGKYLVAFATADDDYDFDFGYTGKIQFGAVLRDPKFVDGGDAGNGIECDNDGTGTNATPTTRPVLSNITWVGANNAAGTLANHNYANRFRRACAFSVRNSVMIGFPKAGLSIESPETATYLSNGTAEFKNNLVHAVINPFLSNATAFTAAQMETQALAAGCKVYTSADDVKLTAPFNLTAPNFLPASGSPATAANVASFTGLDAFFTTTTYVGGFGTDNWLSGWTRFFANGQ